jgi:hypothetical protein
VDLDNISVPDASPILFGSGVNPMITMIERASRLIL